MKTYKKCLLLLSSVMALCGCNNNKEKVSISPEPSIVETDDNSPYELYPAPQTIDYKSENIVIPKRVNVLIEDGIDEYTTKKLYNILSSKDVVTNKVEDIVQNGNLGVYLGIYGSNKQVDTWIEEDLSYINEKIDAYYLNISNSGITILGKNTDACFYGLTTLEMIFSQTDRTIKQLEIKDYSDSIYRGFIEGYYGIPWTAEERMELMRFGSQFKSNIYIYAPKDDSYHSTNWRGLYSEDDLQILKEQIQVSKETKTRFAWAIHPLLSNKITLENYDKGLSDIINKFNQLYDAGVRQFFFSADDIDIGVNRDDYETEDDFYEALRIKSAEQGTLQNKLLNDLAIWNKGKEGCYDLLFVPSAYCYESSILHFNMDAYYETLMKGLDESIQFFWTGNIICSSVENLKSEEFGEYTNGRVPVMWLNWPVTDFAPAHLLLSKAEVLNKKYENGNVDFAGIVTNPMQQAEPSKLSIFAICDYTWNTTAFDVDESYKASFKYIEENTTESFYEVAQHLTNAGKFEGKYFEEGTELKNLINNYKYAVENDDNVLGRINRLISYLDELEQHADNFINNGSNKKLIASIRPWVLQVRDYASSLNDYLKIMKGLNVESSEELKSLLESAETKYNRAMNYSAPMLNTVNYNIELRKVNSGIVVLKPFLDEMKAIATDEVKLSLGEPTGIIYAGFVGIYQGSIDNLMDGNEDTYCWFEGQPSDNAYIRIDLESVVEIRDIRILNGNGDGRDFLCGVVEYSNDAKNFTVVGSLNYATETIIDLRSNPIQARFIRIRNIGTPTWASLKEVSINTLGELKDITYTGFKGISAGTLESIFDDNDETYCWFTDTPEAGANITIAYDEEITISTIRILNGKPDGGDCMNGAIQLSEDGVNFVEVGTFAMEENYIDLTSNPMRAKYLRIVDKGTLHWVGIREVSLNVALPENFNAIQYEGLPFIQRSWNDPQNMIDGDLTTYTWFDWHCPKDSYIKLDLKSIVEVRNIVFYQKATSCSIDNSGVNDAFDDVTFYYSINGTDWIQVGESNYLAVEDIIIDLSSSPIQARYIKVVSNADLNSTGVSVREFAVNFSI